MGGGGGKGYVGPPQKLLGSLTPPPPPDPTPMYHVFIKVFSFNSGVMLSSSFSDALLFENVIVVR